MSHTLERRMLLRGAGVVGVSAVGVAATPAAASAHGDEHGDEHGPLGAWLIRHTDDPPSTDSGLAIVSFAAGGVFATEEMPDGTLGMGTWEVDRDGFEVLFFECQPGQGGEPGVVVKIRVHGQVAGDHISGTYRFTVRSASDDSVLARGTGRFRGERLRV
jgi:hypothetical protein